MPDYTRVRIHGDRADVLLGHASTWEIVAARTATSVTFPAVPALDGFSFVPTATDTVTIEALTSVSTPGGFPALRTQPFVEPGAQLTSGRSVVETLYTPTL